MTATTTTTRAFEVDDLVYLQFPGQCSNCGRDQAATLGVVVDLGIYDSYIVSLVDRTYVGASATQRLACCRDELAEVGPGYDGIIHGSPKDVAAAVNAGWLEPGSEFYGCQFRSAP